MFRLLHLSLSLFMCEVLACNTAHHRIPPPTITVAQGLLRGTWFTTREGRRVAGFLGVPYAAPPVGPLRFKNAEKPNPWTGEYAATSDGSACIQRSVIARLPLVPDTYGSEDCLYLNVFTPSISPSIKLAVVVFIHGGYFEVGFGKSFLYGPQYILDENIILVTINYRLGILGFLTLEHPVLPGNLGLKDQRAALRWVQDNIAQFGGDPQAVTLFGESAGAASVHYHMMFTADEGLFRAGICNSGSALAPWALYRSGFQQSLVDMTVRQTACPNTPTELIECLQQLPAPDFQQLLHQARNTHSKLLQKVTMVGPVIESDGVEDALITADPWNTSTHLPLLIGANHMEGLYWLVDLEKDKTDNSLEEFNANYTNILPFNLHLHNLANDLSEAATALKQFYFGTENINRKHFKRLVDLFSDALFNYDLVEAARHNKHNTFFYHMNYQGSNSIVRYLGSKSNYGVSHFDEMFYLFPIGGSLIRNETSGDTFVSKQLVKMWTNFIKYQHPTPDGFPVKWEPVSSSSVEYLNIGQEGFKMESAFLKERMNFWELFSLQKQIKIGK